MLGPLLCPWMWGIVVVVVVVGIQHFPVDGCLATSCSFGVLHHLVCILEMCCKYHFKLKEKNIKA